MSLSLLQGTRTLSWSCHPGTACPLPWRPPCVLVPPSGPAQPGQGARGQRGQPCSREPPALGVLVAAGAGTNTPGDGPVLTVPCHQGPQAGARRVWRRLGRVAGAVKPRTGMGSSPRPQRPHLPWAPAEQCGDSPVPRAPLGTLWSTRVPARAEPSLLLQSQSCSGRDPHPRGGRGGKGTRRNEGEALRAESPRGRSRAAPTLHRPVQKSWRRRQEKQIDNNNKK